MRQYTITFVLFFYSCLAICQSTRLDSVQYFKIVDSISLNGYLILDKEIESLFFLGVNSKLDSNLSERKITRLIKKNAIEFLLLADLERLTWQLNGETEQLDCSDGEFVKDHSNIATEKGKYRWLYLESEFYVILMPYWLTALEMEKSVRMPLKSANQTYIKVLAFKCPPAVLSSH